MAAKYFGKFLAFASFLFFYMKVTVTKIIIDRDVSIRIYNVRIGNYHHKFAGNANRLGTKKSLAEKCNDM